MLIYNNNCECRFVKMTYNLEQKEFIIIFSELCVAYDICNLITDITSIINNNDVTLIIKSISALVTMFEC
jgi:uncharacterized protein YbcV (DUF1398 family)